VHLQLQLQQPWMSYGSRLYSIFIASILASFEALPLITFINLLPFFTRQLSPLGARGVCVMSIVAIEDGCLIKG